MLECNLRAGGRGFDNRPNRIEAVSARHERRPRLVQPDLALERIPLVLAHVGQVGHHEVDVEDRIQLENDLQAEARSIRARDLDRVA